MMEERRLPGDVVRRVVQVMPSAHWPRNAVVLVTDCGHRHVRQRGFVVGSEIHCPFCGDTTRPAQPPDIGSDVPGGGAV